METNVPSKGEIIVKQKFDTAERAQMNGTWHEVRVALVDALANLLIAQASADAATKKRLFERYGTIEQAAKRFGFDAMIIPEVVALAKKWKWEEEGKTYEHMVKERNTRALLRGTLSKVAAGVASAASFITGGYLLYNGIANNNFVPGLCEAGAATVVGLTIAGAATGITSSGAKAIGVLAAGVVGLADLWYIFDGPGLPLLVNPWKITAGVLTLIVAGVALGSEGTTSTRGITGGVAPDIGWNPPPSPYVERHWRDAEETRAFIASREADRARESASQFERREY